LGNLGLEVARGGRVVDALNLDGVGGRLFQVVGELEHLNDVSSEGALEGHRALRAGLEALE